MALCGYSSLCYLLLTGLSSPSLGLNSFLFLHLSIPGSSTQGRHKKEKPIMVLKKKRAGALLGHVYTPQWVLSTG